LPRRDSLPSTVELDADLTWSFGKGTCTRRPLTVAPRIGTKDVFGPIRPALTASHSGWPVSSSV